jgi:hypothetical protein
VLPMAVALACWLVAMFTGSLGRQAAQLQQLGLCQPDLYDKTKGGFAQRALSPSFASAMVNRFRLGL